MFFEYARLLNEDSLGLLTTRRALTYYSDKIFYQTIVLILAHICFISKNKLYDTKQLARTRAVLDYFIKNEQFTSYGRLS